VNVLNKRSRPAGRQGVVLRRGGWARGKQLPTVKKTLCYKMLQRVSYLAGCCEHGNEPSGSIQGGEFLSDSAPWN
jgi:hypothetical protein